MELFDQFFDVYHDDNGSFSDKTFFAKDYSGDPFTIDLNATQDYLYIGFYKPFNRMYVEMKVANTNANSFTIQYYDKNSDSFTNIPGIVVDESIGFTRSGFIYFNVPRNSSGEYIWEPTAINSVSRYWIRIRPSANHSATTQIQGLNLVFSDDRDLIEEKTNIVTKYATAQPTASWILKHQSARNEIIQYLKNHGYRKVGNTVFSNTALLGSGTSIRYKDLTQFDLFNISQVRQASKYYALANIYQQELSDNPEDKFAVQGKIFLQKALDSMQLLFVSLDKDDNGEKGFNEESQIRTIGIIRK